ncbi:uncharacterized protein C4orf54 homolog [Pangasianodon hypophthalmus]|uniref:uncharacterized protein C4orf54 homolog n=1 Tax=Pangasianodon hypophthalmus TaxID=310915 RepID=UPI002307745A|nr:uncharacterized protein C4orf54 homolog [Pangasianodon hypophthalmus]
MAASEKALIYGGDTHCALASKVLRVVAAPKDSNYVDLNELLDLKLGETKAVQVSFTGQRDTLQRVRLPSAEHLPTRKCVNLECWENGTTEGATETNTAGSSERPRLSHGNLTDCPVLLEELDSEGTPEILEKETKALGDGDLRRTDLCLSEKSESDDEVSLVIADYCVHELADDEAHYITTREIQLSELDHDVDCDFETASTWDIDDDHQVYSFVDYASADSDEPAGVQGEGNEDEAHRSTAVSCSQAESDPGDRTRSATSHEKAPECQGKSTGHIHLSIKATSRAINKPSNVQEKDGGHPHPHPHAVHTGDMSRCVLKDTKGEKCLIALPGRLHFGSKFKGKDVTEYSSGTSSAVSELDDADKEVRNLTARAFRSLAYPYLDAINFSTSSESSASERSKGLNRWSALVDLKYGNVNVSKGGGHNIVAHQSASSNFQLAQRRESKGITGLTLTSRRAPPVEIFALNGNLVNPKNASSTKKIELMGKIGQGQSGVIRLTETLNFRCNVKAGPPANERRMKSARTAGGSRSADEVTNPRQKAHSKPPCHSEEAMEDVHKKSIFASSILKNVISKKMQFEQERKMERGEICEPGSHEHEAHRDKAARTGLHRQSSKLSETGSDFSIVCLDELGDIVDSGSCDAKDNERHEETLALASETNLESQNCAAFDAKKGAADASRGALIRSQNSAFRSWRDEELELQAERENEQTPGTDSTSSKLTKMSRLFVPSIQLVSDERELEKPEPSADRSRAERSMNTLSVSDAAQKPAASRSPEIKISLRSLRDNRSDAFSIAKLLTPSTGCSAGGLLKTNEESKYQALTAALKGDSSDRIPHFTVRDIRDKAKLQAPIHQVRDVRKLVKSSYHFVSLDSNSADMEHKTSKLSTFRNPTTLPPIVIKCQSVNTNSNAKQSEKFADSSNHRLAEDIQEADGSHPQVSIDGINTGSAQVSKPTDRVHLANIKQEETPELRIETKSTTKRQEKVCDPGEKKADPKMAALEKLQAAVKTMEQLYVFDKNEWKRKSKPQPITDSHVLSLLSSEHHGGNEQDQGNASSSSVTMRQDSFSSPDKMVTAGQQSTRKEEKETFKTSHTPSIHEKRKDTKTLMHLGGNSNKKISSQSHSQKSLVPVTTSSAKAPQMHVSSSASISSIAVKNPKSPKLPVSLNITKSKPITEKSEKLSSNTGKANKAGFAPVQFTSSVDSENYITIPVKPYATDTQQSHMVHSSSTKSHGDIHQPPKHSSTVMETRSPDTPTAMIYHHPLPITMHAAQPHVICFSPTVQPSPVPTDHFQSTQRKMLLDPTTGNYYLVDTPVQPATRRLYDPETGQYVDVPMPQRPPMTPVPVPISPLALSPGGYGHTYMFYPGYMASTVIPARTIQSQLSMQSEVEAGDKSHAGQQGDGAYMESPYYMPSGKSLQLTPGAQHVTTGRVANSKVPVISITSQQGPRIIAPPSFDGTTMSFVVEHR